MKENENEKEIIFMDILTESLQQFTEYSEEDVLIFICTFLDKLKNKGIVIK